MKTNASHLSDDVLVRLFFRRLWQGYDSSGISFGRSLQACLVEAYMGLEQYEDLPELYWDLKDFADEAVRRGSSIDYKQQIFGGLEDLSFISNADISLLCLEALRVWYQIHEGQTTREGYVANIWESRFIDMVLKIVPIPFFPYFKSDAQIIMLYREAHDRVRKKYEVLSL